jgi:hypothetical protein
MNIDIAMTVKVVLFFLAITVVVSMVMAFRSINAGRTLQFYQKRQVLIYHGWRLFILALGLGLFGFLIFRFGEPVAYRYFPPSPTITVTPTVTQTPTITNTPSMTFTPTITMTLSQTYTPALPEQVQATIQTPVGVDTSAIFSPITFSDQIKDGVVIEEKTNFDGQVKTIYGGYSYDRMVLGVQWSAVWLFGDQIICSETRAWTWSQGGYGFTDCTREAGEWQPGTYEVQIFVGSTWKSSGRFVINPSAADQTLTAQVTPSFAIPTQTPTPAP